MLEKKLEEMKETINGLKEWSEFCLPKEVMIKYLFIISFFAFNTLSSQVMKLIISYSHSSEFSYLKLKILNDHFLVTTIDTSTIDDKQHNAISQTPQWKENHLKTFSAKLSRYELSELIGHVKNFDKLQQSVYGDVPDGSRYYAYTISACYNSPETKEITYRSSPQSSPRPKEFEELENYLNKLIKDKIEKK